MAFAIGGFLSNQQKSNLGDNHGGFLYLSDILKYSPKKDLLGRYTGRVIEYNNAKIAEERISYVKVGDHATGMPSRIWYGNKNGSKYNLTDNLKYTYDKMGNISEIFENGMLLTKYSYDKLNRLVREDNKKLGKTYTYAYDNNGNILSKKTYDFTLKESERLIENTSTEKTYIYDGDKLVCYDGRWNEYDSVGNPTKYRNNVLKWVRGRMLKNNFPPKAYDFRGKRVSELTKQIIKNICRFDLKFYKILTLPSEKEYL